jgi:hypothetical protein
MPGFSLRIRPEVDKIGQTKGFCLSWLWDKIIVCPASVIPPFPGLGREIAVIVVYLFDMFVELVAYVKDKLPRGTGSFVNAVLYRS